MGTANALRRLVLWTVLVLIAAGGFLVGRATTDASRVRDAAYAQGHAAGVVEGQGEGMRYGRALQLSLSAPVAERDIASRAFDAGYTAGFNDAFGGFDGGWQPGLPYIVVVGQGSGGIVYRFTSRTPMQADVAYKLCPGSDVVCHS